MTYKVHCNCQHQFQDNTYGKGIRIANSRAKERTDGTKEVRCTVCGALHIVEAK